MHPLLDRESALAPDLTLFQRLLAGRLLPPGQAPTDGWLKVAVRQLPGAMAVRFAQALPPQETGHAVLFLCPILPKQPACTVVQRLPAVSSFWGRGGRLWPGHRKMPPA